MGRNRIKIYHNPRCSKSREALSILQARGIEIDVIKYLDTSLSIKEVKSILRKLNIPPSSMIRKKEDVWKKKNKKEDLTDEQIIQLMVEHPRIIERPIVINHDQAVIARPSEKVLTIID